MSSETITKIELDSNLFLIKNLNYSLLKNNILALARFNFHLFLPSLLFGPQMYSSFSEIYIKTREEEENFNELINMINSRTT